jgi:type IV secretory pathway VirB4 component
MDAVMMSLREYRSKASCLADLLPWAALVAPGVVLNMDGSFQRTMRFRGPDLDSATPAELVAVTARLNSALRRSRHAYLHSTVFTKRQRVRVPETPTYLDALLADESLTGGLEPKLSHHHLRTLTLTGFPTETFPACSPS